MDRRRILILSVSPHTPPRLSTLLWHAHVFLPVLLKGSFLGGGPSWGEEDPEAGGYQVHSEESVGRQREQHREWDCGASQVRSRSAALASNRRSLAGAAFRETTHAWNICAGSTECVTKCMVSVETVGLCAGNVRSKEDRPIFSVPVARATAHRGWDGVEFPAAVYWRKEKETRRVEKWSGGVGYMGKEGTHGRMEGVEFS